MKVLASIQRFLNDEEGASGIEYAMIAGMVAVVLAGSSGDIRTAVAKIFTTVATNLKAAAG
jgi:pilus assembly protein Flp/PilA